MHYLAFPNRPNTTPPVGALTPDEIAGFRRAAEICPILRKAMAG